MQHGSISHEAHPANTMSSSRVHCESLSYRDQVHVVKPEAGAVVSEAACYL